MLLMLSAVLVCGLLLWHLFSTGTLWFNMPSRSRYPVRGVDASHYQGQMNWDREVFFRYGKILLREENPVLHEFLILEKKYCSDLLKELSVNEDIPHVFVRMEEVKTDLALNADALQLVSEPGLFEDLRELS